MPLRLLPRSLALVMALGLGSHLGCADEGDRGPTAAGGFRPRSPGELTVATADLPTPGFWTGPPAAPTGGFERDLAAALADRFDLPDVTVVEVPFQDLVAGDLGGADLALAQLTPTGDRDRHLDFSSSYLPAPPGALVRAGTDVPDLHAARRLRWAVQRSTTLEEALDDDVRPEDPPRRVSSLTRVVDLVRAGDVDAALLDLPTALAAAGGSAGELAVAAQLPGDDVLAAALPDGSTNRLAVDSALRRLTADGTLEELAEEWLDTDATDGAPEVPVVRTGA